MKHKGFTTLGYVAAVKLRSPAPESRSYLQRALQLPPVCLPLCHRLYCLLQGVEGVHLLIIWQSAWEKLQLYFSGSSRQHNTEASWASVCTGHGARAPGLLPGLRKTWIMGIIWIKGILSIRTAFSLPSHTQKCVQECVQHCAPLSFFCPLK